MWWGPRRIKIELTDPALIRYVRHHGPRCLIGLEDEERRKILGRYYEEMEHVLSNVTHPQRHNVPDLTRTLTELFRGNNHLYRAIQPKEYRQFLRSGHTRTLSNTDRDHTERNYEANGTSPDRAMYAYDSLERVWQYTAPRRRTKHAIIVVYSKSHFRQITHEMYEIKSGSFESAVIAYIIISYR